MTLTPSELEFFNFPKLVKETNAIYAMEHGGFLLRPPVALLTKDINHFDSPVVKPYKKVWTEETEEKD